MALLSTFNQGRIAAEVPVPTFSFSDPAADDNARHQATGALVAPAGSKIASVHASAYTENLNRTGSATYTYKVCVAAPSTCSNAATVSFLGQGEQ